MGKTKQGEPKKVLRLEYKRTTARAFLEYAIPKILPFILHQHNARWQDLQCKASLEKLEVGDVLSFIHFAENYSFKGQDEVQSEHWFNFQMSILVHITYTVNLTYDVSNPQSKRLSTQYLYYISDDRVHDSLFVQFCLDLHWKGLVEAGFFPRRHIMWSDGCSVQFKCATAWFYVSRYLFNAKHPKIFTLALHSIRLICPLIGIL